MKTALFPGTFDPPTFGHLDVIQRAVHLCERLIVSIAENPTKQSRFTFEERTHMLKLITKNQPNIEIAQFNGLVVDFARDMRASFLIRGLRAFADFEYEFQMAVANRQLSGLETVFLMSDERHAHISSSLIREIASFGGSLQGFVPPEIEPLIAEKMIQVRRNSTGGGFSTER